MKNPFDSILGLGKSEKYQISADDIVQIQHEPARTGDTSPPEKNTLPTEGLHGKSSRAISCVFPDEVYSDLHRIKEEKSYPNMASVVLRACELFIRDRKKGRRI